MVTPRGKGDDGVGEGVRGDDKTSVSVVIVPVLGDTFECFGNCCASIARAFGRIVVHADAAVFEVVYEHLIGDYALIWSPSGWRSFEVVCSTAEGVPVGARGWGIDAVSRFRHDGVGNVCSTVVGVFRYWSATVIRPALASELLVLGYESLLEDKGEDD